MAGLPDVADAHSQPVGRNSLELLLFRLAADQCFGIDVFKVREVIQCPQLIPVPESHPAVLGTVDSRDNTISVVDLAHAIGGSPLEDPRNKLVIVTEYNDEVQGLLVDSVDHIVSLDWKQILPPPEDSEHGTYLSAVTQVDQEPVQIIDIENLLQDL